MKYIVSNLKPVWEELQDTSTLIGVIVLFSVEVIPYKPTMIHKTNDMLYLFSPFVLVVPTFA